MAEFENRQIDKRVVHRYLRKGIVEDREYDKHLKALPDLADQAIPIEASFEAEDEADDEG